MQVSKINAQFGLNHGIQLKNQTNPLKNKTQTDTFEKSDVSFKSKFADDDIIKYKVDWGYEHFCLPTVAEFDVYYPKQRKLNILKGDDDHLKDVAESLCMYRNEDIINFSKIYYPLRFGLDKEKSVKAFMKIMPFVIEQREKIANLQEIKAKLETKSLWQGLSKEEENGLKYAIEEIERIDKKCRRAQSNYLTSQHLEVDDGSDKSWQID